MVPVSGEGRDRPKVRVRAEGKDVARVRATDKVQARVAAVVPDKAMVQEEAGVVVRVPEPGRVHALAEAGVPGDKN